MRKIFLDIEALMESAEFFRTRTRKERSLRFILSSVINEIS